MAAWISGVAASLGTQKRGILWEFFIGPVATPDPERARLFRIPRQRAFGAVNLKPQTSAAPGADLRHGHGAAQISIKMKQD